MHPFHPALLAVLIMSGCESISSSDSLHITPHLSVCNFLKDAKFYSDRTISIRGYIVTPGRHFTGLSDSNCNNQFIPFGVFSKTPVGDDALESAMTRAAEVNRVYVTVTGTFRYRPNEVPYQYIIPDAFSDIELQRVQ
jgi:hypothetical protein